MKARMKRYDAKARSSVSDKAKEKYTRLLGEQAMRDIYILHEADVSAKKGIQI